MVNYVWGPKGRRGAKGGKGPEVGSVSSIFRTSFRDWFFPRFLLEVDGRRKASRKRALRKISLPVVIEEEDGVFGAWIPGLPGCVAMGETERAVLKNLEMALRDVLALHREKGSIPKFRDPGKGDLSFDPSELKWISVPW